MPTAFLLAVALLCVAHFANSAPVILNYPPTALPGNLLFFIFSMFKSNFKLKGKFCLYMEMILVRTPKYILARS